MLTRSLLARLVPPLAVFKLGLGLYAFAVTWERSARGNPAFPYPLYGLLAVAFGATGLLLLLGGQEDRRALSLGSFFLVTATAWSNGPLDLYMDAHPDVWLFAFTDALETHAFLAFYLGIFVRDFPSAPSLSVRRRIQLVARLGAAAGAAHFILSLLLFIAERIPQGVAWAE
ncbi:MAG TPA: hypothetical protein VG477_13825, partial [Thermoanaerobaculia bacterium]|nr:hypothetical protein [Thermoanaerobaculia bacterium]